MKSAIFTKTWPYAAIILAHTIWGVNFIVAKLTLQEFPPMSLAFLRFAIATLLLAPFLIAEGKNFKIEKEDLPKLLGVGLLMVTLNIGFFYAGLERTTVISASVLTLTIPVASILAGWWFLKEKIYTVNLSGIILGILGAVLIIGLPILNSGDDLAQVLIGNFLIILASISWVAGAIISKDLLKKYSTLTVTAVIFFVGMISFLIPAASEYLKNPGWTAQVTYLGIFGLLYIAIASSISAYFLFEWGLHRLGVTRADMFQYLEPVIAAALGVLILNEQVRLPLIIGILLIASGAYLSTLVKIEHKHHKAHRT